MAPPVLTMFEYYIEDIKTGKKTKPYKQLTHSFTRNYLNYVCLQAFAQDYNMEIANGVHGEGTLTMQKTDGNYKSGNQTMMAWYSNSSSSISHGNLALNKGNTYSNKAGMQFGTDNTPETLNDFKLGAVIIGSGNGTTSMSGPVYDSTTKEWSQYISGSFKNIGMENIEIGEFGIYGWANNGSYNINESYCLLRDTVDPKIILEPDKMISLSYRFTYLIGG